MKLRYIAVLILLFQNFLLISQGRSYLQKIDERIIELKRIANDQRNTITLLEQEIRFLRNRVDGDADELRRKVEELFLVRSELSSLKFDYERIKSELELSSSLNDEYRDEITQLSKEKELLSEMLEDANLEINLLLKDLEESKYKNQVLEAKNDALEEVIDNLLNDGKGIYFAEIAFLLPNSYEISIAYGYLFKKNSIFLGLKTGYSNYSKNKFKEIILLDRKVQFVPLSIELRVPLNKRTQGFKFRYYSKSENVEENIKYFLSLSAGAGLPISRNDSRGVEYKPGLNWMVSLGAMLPVMDNANVYALIGFKNQQIRYSYELNNFVEGGNNIHLGIGINF